MFTALLGLENEQQPAAPKEGDLFKVIELHGQTFEIRYGFYAECDRNARYAEPMEIYPDFIAAPQYTDDGTPFVTEMQAHCKHFAGKRDENSVCGDCLHYRRGDELLGTCIYPMNKNRSGVKNVVQIE